MKVLGTTKDGFEVTDRQDSHVQSHRNVLGILPEALSKVSTYGRNFLIEEIIFDQIVGESICIPTRSGDEIVYAQRPRRSGLTRFVKNLKPIKTDRVTVILKKAEEGHYVLITAFIGSTAPAEPWDERAFSKQHNPKQAWAESIEFWNSHALVWGVEETMLGTETTICPW